ncbi:MAG: HEAT repeat domain-containing protein [Puia sp.]|nr:HEAT repeat domain-containing protein [Puia sp.]
MPFLEVHPIQYLKTGYLVVAMFVLLGVLFSVVLFMLLYLLARKKREKQKERWHQPVDLLIRRAIFFEESPDRMQIPITPGVSRWLKRSYFRQFLLDEMITAKKSFSGNAAENLVRLYNQLRLERLSLTKLSSLKWHIRARCIQELAAMDQKDQVGKIYRLTNHPNEFIRMEAQSAIVHFYGFEGLRFLDVVSQPISEWQQIQLLAQLPKTLGAGLKGMESWLKSSNSSVISFALKLARIHRRFELHDAVAGCLDHHNPAVRIQALKCLQDICNETTATLIIGRYEKNDRLYRIAALETLQCMGPESAEQQIGFLQKELLNEDDTIKLATARVLATVSGRGTQSLDDFEKAGEYPWNEIIRQAKGEQTKSGKAA